VPILQVASSNAGKIAEFRLGIRLWLAEGAGNSLPRRAVGEQRTVINQHLSPRSTWIVEAVPRMDSLPPCVEDGGSFTANAQKKALHYSRLVRGLVMGDDSGLEVDALAGAPGIYSRRFAGGDATDADNNAKLLAQISGLPAASRTAQFVCMLAVARNGEVLAEFRGVVRGIILESPRGTGGFGYDPLFLDPASNKTFAELPAEEKFARSHRGRAMRAMLEWLEEREQGTGNRE